MSTWESLHKRALIVKSNDMAFLNNFSKHIPRFNKTCKCTDHWLQTVKKYPPRFGKADEYFEWTVFIHNEVNTRLGKPIMSVTDAKTLYI